MVFASAVASSGRFSIDYVTGLIKTPVSNQRPRENSKTKEFGSLIQKAVGEFLAAPNTVTGLDE